MQDDERPRGGKTRLITIGLAVVPLAIAALAAGRWLLGGPDGATRGGRDDRPIPVEVAPVEVGPLELTRELTGTLEAFARATVAAEIDGTVDAVLVDLADEVASGAVIARLDPRELIQLEAAARADLAVARARVEAAEGAAEVADRALARTRGLAERGVSSERALDEARAEALARRGALTVANAEVSRARAALGAASLQRARADVRGRWPETQGPRRVAARHVDEGARVSVGDPIVDLVDLDPLLTVLQVGADDYQRLSVGQAVRVSGPGGVEAAARVARVAPVFDPVSRQARLEVEVDNPDGTLQPGMFVRARATLDRVESATLVPETALVMREGRSVVFVLEDGRVREVEVEVGLRGGGRVEIRSPALEGSVVTLGHQRLQDGAAVRVVEGES